LAGESGEARTAAQGRGGAAEEQGVSSALEHGGERARLTSELFGGYASASRL
jgi:hypothetical protein